MRSSEVGAPDLLTIVRAAAATETSFWRPKRGAMAGFAGRPDAFAASTGAAPCSPTALCGRASEAAVVAAVKVAGLACALVVGATALAEGGMVALLCGRASETEVVAPAK